jgi:hypothetical protein
MGWTGTLKTMPTRDFLIQQFSGENETHKWELHDLTIKGTVAYGLFLQGDKETNIVMAEAIVILLRHEDGQIFFKEMGESSMPYYYGAPLKLLDKLDQFYPPVNENAKKWREKCRFYAERNKIKVNDGDIIKFAKPFNFRLFMEDTFKVVKDGNKVLFRTRDGTVCKITKWKEKEFQLSN